LRLQIAEDKASNLADEKLADDKTLDLVDEKPAEDILDNDITKDKENKDDDEEAGDEEIAKKIASFVKVYRDTVKQLESNMEQISSHMSVASKKIGKEIKNTLKKYFRKEEL